VHQHAAGSPAPICRRFIRRKSIGLQGVPAKWNISWGWGIALCKRDAEDVNALRDFLKARFGERFGKL